MTEALVVLARVADARADELERALGALQDDAGSPFARVPGTFLARFAVLAPPARRGRAASQARYLLWSADVNAPATAWLRRVCLLAGAELEPVFACCEDCPGLADPGAFADWALARPRRLRVGFSVIGSPGATVEAVGAALRAREALGRFAVRAQTLDDAALRAAWRELPWA